MKPLLKSSPGLIYLLVVLVFARLLPSSGRPPLAGSAASL